MSDSVRPQRRQPTRFPHPWDSPGKNTGVGCHFLLQCMKVKSESEVTQLCPTLTTTWTAAHQAPPSMGFSRQEYWSGVSLPSPKRLQIITKKHLMCLRQSNVEKRFVLFSSLTALDPFLLENPGLLINLPHFMAAHGCILNMDLNDPPSHLHMLWFLDQDTS